MEAVGIWGATVARGSGIGREILRRLAANNEQQPIYLFGRSQAKLEETAKNFGNVKGLFAWDIEKEDKVALYAEYLVSNNIKTLICSVGVGIGDPLPFLTKNDFLSMVNSNLIVPTLIIKYSLVPLKKLQGGRIIVFGSIVAVKPSDGASGYTASKTGLKGLIEATRHELKKTFPEVSLHSIYATSVNKIGINSVIESTFLLTRLPYGVHADIILDK
jgi:short-subunit dehydrogenase